MEQPAVHHMQHRVRYGEVDRMGLVHHPRYLHWFETGRIEFLRARGLSYRDMEDAGILLVVVETGTRHHRPADYDDVVDIETRLVDARGVRYRFEYEVRRDETVLATGHTVLATTDPRGRLKRIPASWREPLTAAGVTGRASSKGQSAAADAPREEAAHD